MIGLIKLRFNETQSMHNLPANNATGPVTESERAYALDALTTTQTALRQALTGLSAEQFAYKANPDRWSITECVEHIALVEKRLFRAALAGMNVPADPDGRSRIHVSDVDVIKAVRSRSVTMASPTPFVPTGRFADANDALQAFDQQREATIRFVQTEPGDLRTHYFDHPAFGTLDLYQAILVMASHVERHRKQIEEVKAKSDFPG